MKQFKHPFPFSDDNKRYHTWNYYLKHHYGQKVAKVPLDAGFTCPNRDGTKGYGGCTYCSAAGSGDSIVTHGDLIDQFEKGYAIMARKWPNCKAMAYFQAYTNTYGPIEKLQASFVPFIEREDVCALAIATRADCLNEEKIAFLCELAKKKEIWIELGLQTIHDATAEQIHRGHTFFEFQQCVQALAPTPLKICVHLINSLPNESIEDMIESAKVVGSMPIDAVKIHMLHIMNNTQMAMQYQQHPFPLLSMKEYVDVVIQQLEVLPPSIIIQRLTGDALAKDLIAPAWTLHKIQVLNDIDKAMAKRNTWQGKKL